MSLIKPDFSHAPLAFGPRLGEIFQLGYIVADVEAAIADFHRCFGIGPWTLLLDFPVATQTYKGKPTDLAISVAVSYSNDMMIELIQQKNDVPSVYMDTVKKRGYGLHHYAVTVNDLAGQSAAFEAQKIEIPFRGVTGPMVDNMPVFYADTTSQIGGMLEVCEYNPTMEQVFASIRHSVRNWDGKNLIIRM